MNRTLVTQFGGRRNRWRVLSLFLCLILGASLLSGQSLAEIAKKEKERREAVKARGAATVITDRELRRGTRLPPTPSSASATNQEAEEGAEAEEGEEEEEAVDETKTREYWQNRIKGVREKIARLEEELNSTDLNWGEGLRTDVNPMGNKNLQVRQDKEAELAAARDEMEAIRLEGRRSGAPPGWLR